MQTKTETETNVAEKLYQAYRKANGDSLGERAAFICGLQAAMLFMDIVKDEATEPMQAVRAFIGFKTEVQEEYDKLGLPTVDHSEN